jgi:carboxyvinyl-carboxyphosphonate phosphorylmutase
VSRVPIVVDGDHGYGNALNVMRTVQELTVPAPVW